MPVRVRLRASLIINYLRSFCRIANLGVISLRTQFLRTRLQNTSINDLVAIFLIVKTFSKPLFFSCAKCDICGAQGKKLPLTTRRPNVASVATLVIPIIWIAYLTTQFYFEVRKKCVTSGCHQYNIRSHLCLNNFALGIVNPLLPSILFFLTLFSFIGDPYGNDS